MMEGPDRYFTLKDLESYYETQKKVEDLYKNRVNGRNMPSIILQEWENFLQTIRSKTIVILYGESRHALPKMRYSKAFVMNIASSISAGFTKDP